MTNEAWEEKGKCFFGHTNSTFAIAGNITILSPVRPRTRLEWRDVNPPPVMSRSRTRLKWRDVKTNKWKIIFILAIGLILIFWIIFIFKR
ncbi:hypothetical protein [Crinalium epipsammum]|nr:hypothetical protein [Crinalium epipsammum]